ncbi:MAG: hypothetical protein M1830_006456 [Pleopsidium flavum]|nr:MAG: hypothetical protein M1830_006456 [Pleopsidium flavum]
MILAIIPFICLLFLTGAVSANPDEQLPPSVPSSDASAVPHPSLQKREDYCSDFLASDLKYNDCMAAYRSMRDNVPSDMAGGRISPSSLFTAMTTTAERYRLPQSFQSGNCVISVTLADGVDMAVTLWSHQRTAAKQIIDWCVSTHGFGGRMMLRATTVTVKKYRKPGKGAAGVSTKCSKITDQTALQKCLDDADRAAENAFAALNRFTIHLDAMDYILPSQ